MITEARLEEMMKVFEEELKRDNLHTKISTQEDIDILKLARLGLWARDVGMPALEDIEYNLEGMKDGSCQACSYNLATIRPEAKEALSKLPKDTTK